MKCIKQFRYYGDNNEKNYPANLSKDQLKNGNIFQNYNNIIQLGIQAKPTTEFFLNNSDFTLTVGGVGLYELNLEGIGAVTAIKFTEESLNKAQESTNGLIIDIIYDEVGVDL